MSERERRIGLNEAVFRQVNERIEQVATSFELREEALDFVCECSDAACVERIALSRGEYEHVRSEPRRFAVYPGHVEDGVEQLIEHHKGYDVVEKSQAEAKQIAEQTDPRRD